MVWAWMHSLPYARGTRTELWCGHGCTGCCRVLLEHERNYGLRMDALVTVCSWNTNGIMLGAWMLSYSLSLEHEHEQNYGSGMDALVTVCFWNTNGIMVWAWMRWLPYALGTRAELCMDALLIALPRTRKELWFGHGCTRYRMLLEHERNYGLGMDALVTVRF